jgi:hypothetical protein
MGKVVTSEHAQHFAQGLGSALVVPAGAFEV